MSNSTSTRPWLFITNPFVVASQYSFTRAHRIGNYTLNALNAQNANPLILVLYNFLLPIYTAYDTAFIEWLSQQGVKVGNTSSLTLLLDQIVPNIDDWEYAIRGVYKKGSPAFIAIFPKGHSPFNHGKIENRIAAIDTLNTTLAGIPALATTAAEVAAFALLLSNAYKAQQGSISTKNVNSTDLEAKRKSLADGLYWVLGGLIQANYKTPEKNTDYFDIQTLRNLQQCDFTGHTIPNGLDFIAKRTLDDDYNIILDNSGITPLRFFFSPNNTPTHVGEKMVEVPPNTIMSVAAGTIRVDASCTFLFVLNTSTTNDGRWEVAF